VVSQHIKNGMPVSIYRFVIMSRANTISCGSNHIFLFTIVFFYFVTLSLALHYPCIWQAQSPMGVSLVWIWWTRNKNTNNIPMINICVVIRRNTRVRPLSTSHF